LSAGVAGRLQRWEQLRLSFGKRAELQRRRESPVNESASARGESRKDLPARFDVIQKCQGELFACPPRSPTLSGANRGLFINKLEEPDMALRIGDDAPDFTAETTEGTIRFHEWIGDGWAILFSHPKDFTPVCTTELGYMAGLKPEFDKRNCKIIGLSVDPVSDHKKWAKDIQEATGHAPNYPLIGDADLNVAQLYDMIHPNAVVAKKEGRTAADNQTIRSVFVIGPDKKIKLILTYPMSTGRNFDEVLRVLDSIQLTAKHKVATPVNWKNGDDVIIVPAVSDEEAKQRFPGGWKSPKPYMRVVPQPK
jgi:alkyl hydroperoxide reductase subunit AhpC